MKLRVSEIQRFCMHDGPGVRTTVFLKGCPLRCAWCHNPETQRHQPELLYYPKKCIGCGLCASVCKHRVHDLTQRGHAVHRELCQACGACAQSCPTGALEMCGREMTVAEILAVLERDRAFYGEHGGMTLSGGEPFAQKHAAVALLQACREHGISAAVETCGYADADVIRAAIPFVDLFLWDVKDTDGERHRRFTGVTNQPILQNLRLADSLGARIRLRCILVNGINTRREHYEKIAELAASLHNLDGVDLIPYHAYGGTKSVFLGQADSGRRDWIPTHEQMEEARGILRAQDIP